MLAVLTVKNLAIIDHIQIEFANGLTVLTGETGAGKSLIIDAISLLLGERAPSGLIRNGANKLIVEGVFTNYHENINLVLQKYGIDISDDLIIRREILDTGKSYIRLNGIVVSLSQVEEIAKYLVDIHTQGDNRKLFNRNNFVDLLDDQKTNEYLKCYQDALKEYKMTLQEYTVVKEKMQNEQKEYEFLRYSYDELVKASLNVDEINIIEQELFTLNNYDQLYKNLTFIKKLLDDNNIVDALYEINNNLSKIVVFSKDLDKLQNVVGNSYYELADFEKAIIDKIDNLDYDVNLVDSLNERLSFLKTLERKYQMNINSLIKHRDALSQRINECENQDMILQQHEKNVESTFYNVVSAASILTTNRKANAERLLNSIKKTLNDLCLPKVQLAITFAEVVLDNPFDSSNLRASGVDIVDIKISFNPGEPLKSLPKVASGGEMSRVMLALKTHLLQESAIGTIIFDEIDTGVSGEVAKAMADKLKMISKYTQVLTITHLPIVACAADQHLHVTKSSTNLETKAGIDELDYDKRVKEIAKMLSSQEEDCASIQLAVSMIDSFN